MNAFRRVAASTLSGIGLPLVLLAAWAIVPLFTKNRFFPPLSKVLNAFVATWLNQSFLVDVVPSLTRLAVGIILSIVLGIALGVLIGSFRPLRSLLEPVLEFFRAIPPPVLIPVLLLLMGITDEMKVAVIVSGAIWPILLNTIEGVRAVDPVMRETAQSYRIGAFDRLNVPVT